MEHKFPFGIFRPEKNRTTFSDVQLLPEISLWNDRAPCSIYFPAGFSGKQPMFQLIIPLQSSVRLPLSFSHPSLSYPFSKGPVTFQARNQIFR